MTRTSTDPHFVSAPALPSAAGPELAILIVNFRTPELTLDCLRSLEPEVATVPGARVVLVDNGSPDDSVPRLRAVIDNTPGWRDWIDLVVSERNWGFAGGNNRAFEHCPHARHYLLLNSDTIVHRGCLRYCWELMERTPDIGALSCCLLNRDGTVQNVTRRFPTPARLIARALGLPWRFPRWFEWADTEDLQWDRRATRRDVDWVGGAFLWTRGDLIRRMGLLDEEFFFEGEDIEFCERVWRAGLRCHYDPTVTITHLGGGSSDPTRMAKQLRSVHKWRARYVYLRKCHGWFAATLVRVVDFLWAWGLALRHQIGGPTHAQERDNYRAAARLLSSRLDVAR